MLSAWPQTTDLPQEYHTAGAPPKPQQTELSTTEDTVSATIPDLMHTTEPVRSPETSLTSPLKALGLLCSGANILQNHPTILYT